MARPCPSGKRGDKKAHEGSSVLTACVQKMICVKERQCLAQAVMITRLNTMQDQLAPGWEVSFSFWIRHTQESTTSQWSDQEKRLDDDPDGYATFDGDEDDRTTDTLLPKSGNIFVEYGLRDSNRDLMFRDRAELLALVKPTLICESPNFDQSGLGPRPQWLSCLQPQKRQGAYDEVDTLLQTWNGECFRFVRYARSFNSTYGKSYRCTCLIIKVRSIWIQRVAPQPVYHSMRTIQS